MGGLAGGQRGRRPQRDSVFIIGQRLNQRTSSQFCGKITFMHRTPPDQSLFTFFSWGWGEKTGDKGGGDGWMREITGST